MLRTIVVVVPLLAHASVLVGWLFVALVVLGHAGGVAEVIVVDPLETIVVVLNNRVIIIHTIVVMVVVVGAAAIFFLEGMLRVATINTIGLLARPRRTMVVRLLLLPAILVGPIPVVVYHVAPGIFGLTASVSGAAPGVVSSSGGGVVAREVGSLQLSVVKLVIGGLPLPRRVAAIRPAIVLILTSLLPMGPYRRRRLHNVSGRHNNILRCCCCWRCKGLVASIINVCLFHLNILINITS